MEHVRESQHGHMSVLLIMAGFQLEFIMHSLSLLSAPKLHKGYGWRGSETQRAVMGVRPW